jgi:exodeoxyribonuclease-3
VLNVLTINIGAASRDRAEAVMRWFAARHDDVVLLTETSAGAGTTYLLDQFRRAGFAVVNTPDVGDRGAALISRVRLLEEQPVPFSKVSIPARVAVAILDTQPRITVAGVYVPSRDRSLAKTERKETFIGTLLECLHSLPADQRDHLILGGDYNVISRNHRPLHPGFLPFELDLLEALHEQGLTDAHQYLRPDDQEYSWIGRTGDGYRYDYFNVGSALTEHIDAANYLHETRQQRLTDHAAVSMSLNVAPTRLDTADPTGPAEPDSLF